MPTQVKAHTRVEATQNALDFGPWDFFDNDVYDEMFAAQIQLSSLLFAQLIGGVSPTISVVTLVQFLLIIPDQTIRIGLHGVNAQSDGFLLNANRCLKIGTGSINSVSVYNTTTLTCNLVFIVGGRS